MKAKIVTILLVACACGTAAAEQTILIQPEDIDDALVYASPAHTDDNYGNLYYFGSLDDTLTPAQFGGPHSTRSYLRFDVPARLAGYSSEQIVSATMSVYLFQLFSDLGGGSSTFDPDPNVGAIVNCYSLAEPWKELPSDPAPPQEAITWNNQPQTAELLDSITVAGDADDDGRLDYQWLNFDVTDYVRDVLAGSPDYGFVIAPATQNHALFYLTSDAEQISMPQTLFPKLTVTVPAPPAACLWGLLVGVAVRRRRTSAT